MIIHSFKLANFRRKRLEPKNINGSITITNTRNTMKKKEIRNIVITIRIVEPKVPMVTEKSGHTGPNARIKEIGTRRQCINRK
jgi:hypothetical protein